MVKGIAHNMDNQQLFLITSNARSGSTFVQTSLARLCGVFTDHEMLLKSSYPFDGTRPLHVFVSEGWSCKKFLTDLAPASRFVGSRLVLVGFGNHHINHMEELIGTIEPDIKIIHIRRNYFDCLKSSARGHYDVVEENREIPGMASSSLAQTTLWSTMREHAKTIQEIEAMSIGWRTLEQSAAFLVNLFTNDLMLVELGRRANESMCVDYEDIQDKFIDIARFIGCDASQEECDAIMNTPVTKKLPPIPDAAVPNSSELLELCGVLSQGIKNIVDRNIRVSDVWTEEGINIPT